MIDNFKEFFRFRELLFVLTKREIKVRYKQTSLGASWAIIQPFSMMLIFTLIFGFFLKVDSGNIPYPIFSYSALLPWTFFATSFSLGSLSIINSSNLITKIYFPREILPFSNLGAAFLDFLVAGVFFFLLMLFYKVPLSFTLLFLVPIVLVQVIFTAAVILFASAIVVIWRDVKFVIPLLIQLWMFATPVIYPVSKVPRFLQFIYFLDPMAGIIENFRSVSILGKFPDWRHLLMATVISAILFFLSYMFFKQKEKRFADII